MLHEQSAVLSVDGSYFVDANKDIFAHVLNYLRDRKLPPSDVALCVYKCASRLEIQSLRDELELHPSVMAQNILSMYDKFGSTEFKELVRWAVSDVNEQASVFIATYIDPSNHDWTLPDHDDDIEYFLCQQEHHDHGIFIEAIKQDPEGIQLMFALGQGLKELGYGDSTWSRGEMCNGRCAAIEYKVKLNCGAHSLK